jgi:uncharacterized protein YbaA (DUF1428 family)
MARYVDGFVLVIQADMADEYKKMAEGGRDSWMKHGALAYFECRGDDLAPQEMGDERSRTFPELAGAGAGEDVWFSFIIFESKAHRDEVNAKVMKEMGEQATEYEDVFVPFDMTRMAYGGFKVEVEG